MKIKTADLTGPALDWAVAKCGGRGIEFEDPRDPWLTRDGISDQPLHSYTPSTDWSQGGPIIERERIELSPPVDAGDPWSAFKREFLFEEDGRDAYMEGQSPLIAAMRCFVASCLGNEVDVPEELA